jgi:phosphatidylglycerol lysyltransferase
MAEAVLDRPRGADAARPVSAAARWAPLLVGAAVLALFVVGVRRESQAYRLPEILHTLTSIPADRVLAALALTAVGHLVHVGYDILALRYAGYPLRWRRVAFGSLVTYSLSAVTGFTGVVGASLRYRFWSAWGVPTARIVEGVGFAAFTALVGATTTAGAALVLAPEALAVATGVPADLPRWLGTGLLAAVAGYLAACAAVRRRLRVRGVSVRLPGVGLALVQVGVATLDWTIAASVFFPLLLPARVGFASFLPIFLAAQFGGLLLHVPAGLGVFDGVILLLLRPFATPVNAAAALLAYRGIAYLLPGVVAGLAMGVYEIGSRRSAFEKALRGMRHVLDVAVPSALSVAAFLAGVVLLASGATPGLPSRLAWLGRLVPLGAIETAHFLGSLIGVGLLILARGLYRRLDVAYHLTVLALALGIGASLLKGGDYEEALLLAAVLALVVPARHRFYRRATILSGRWSPGWLVAVALAIGATVWLGLFSYRHVAYSNDLWWQFTLHGDAARWLRASVGVAVLVATAALARLLGPSPGPKPAPTSEEMERAAHLAYHSGETRLYLALLGDKSLLFGSRGGALMYAVARRSWIALGDPVGPVEDRSELVWRFKELADRHDGWPVFYEVGPDDLPLYVDLGLGLIKIGEEGRLRLDSWSLEGSDRAHQRRTLRGVERAGRRFEIVPVASVPALLPELRRVSDAWLASKNTREKRFSLGLFDERYVSRFPLAVVRNADAVEAFATIWLSGARECLSLDLMRYVPTAPRGIMEYVITNAMLWGKAEGYAWFNLGMAPLSGLQSRALAPLWSRLGALAFRHGEHFYNFRGLRQYKERFGPVWEPRFLAVPGWLVLPRVLSNLTTLISGGLTGVVTK